MIRFDFVLQLAGNRIGNQMGLTLWRLGRKIKRIKISRNFSTRFGNGRIQPIEIGSPKP
jgi:hypothetical protein